MKWNICMVGGNIGVLFEEKTPSRLICKFKRSVIYIKLKRSR